MRGDRLDRRHGSLSRQPRARRARLILMENSKSFEDSPIGGGPIVRVGERTSTFDPELTYRITRIAEQLAKRDHGFSYQLMPGGPSEATAYQTLGYAATCLCLPLGNYPNMNERTGKVDRETISLSDYQGFVRLLVELTRRLDAPNQRLALRDRLDRVYGRRKHMVGG